jgi:hypothetical protein
MRLMALAHHRKKLPGQRPSSESGARPEVKIDKIPRASVCWLPKGFIAAA